jgi:hypothetical protein
MSKTTKKQSAEFMKCALDILRHFGFKVDHSSYRDYTAETLAGKLHVSIKTDWIACVFDDTQQAVRIVNDIRLNHNSGKWNWMSIDDLDGFYKSLDKIILNPVATPELLAIPQNFN